MANGKIKGGTTGKTKGGVDLMRLDGVSQRKSAVTWILVAHRAGGVLFEKRNGTPAAVVQTFSCPEGRQEHDPGPDQAGRTFEHYGHTQSSGAPRSATVDDGQLRDTRTAQFSTELAAHLESGRAKQGFDHLVLVAEPKFLGTLLGALDGKTRESVDQQFEKDFAHMPVPKMQVAVEKLLMA